MVRPFTPPPECPVCGASVPPNARACPECGADERSGWDEDATRHDGLDLPDDPSGDADSRKTRRTKTGLPIYWWVVAIIAILCLVGLSLGLG